MRVCVSGRLFPALAKGLRELIDDQDIRHETELFGADGGFVPQAQILAKLRSDGWIYLTRFSSDSAVGSELRVLAASKVTTVILHRALAAIHHRHQAAQILRLWDTLQDQAAAHPGAVLELPSGKAPAPWRLLR